MLFLELLKSSIVVASLAALCVIALFVCIVVLLKHFNKYNTRNFWFIFLSIFGIPFYIIDLSIIFGLIRLQNNAVVSAHEYAYDCACRIDGYKTVAQSFVDNQIQENVPNIVAGELADTIEFITHSTAAMMIDKMPDNPIQLMLDKFPILDHFLDENELSGDTAHEIVDSAFIKINTFIKSLIIAGVKYLIIGIFVHCFVAIIFGYFKKRRKDRKLIHEITPGS